MAHVVFLRAANVGGNNVFRPTQLVAALQHLDVTNIGAAGTFVVHGKCTAATVRQEILDNLPFAPEMVIRPAKDIMALVDRDPLKGTKFSKTLRGWVGAMSAKPKAVPTLPLNLPANESWGLRLDGVDGAFAYGIWRHQPRFTMPANECAKILGVSMTVRWWETLLKIAKVIEKRA